MSKQEYDQMINNKSLEHVNNAIYELEKAYLKSRNEKNKTRIENALNILNILVIDND